MKCPNCGGDNCHFMTSTKTHTKGFGVSDACCGMLLLGPLGILCGLCGMESETKTKEFWICDNCGSKFSPNEARRFMEEENSKLKKLLFYREIQAQTAYDTYTNVFGELVKESEERYLQNMYKEEKVIRSNPFFENQKFELIKSKCSNVLTEQDLVYLVIMTESGIVIADKGLVFGDVLFKNIKHIHCYDNCIYVNQICVRMASKEEALAIYKFLDYLYNSGRKQTPLNYASYEELLKELQSEEYVNNERAGHFSSQPEYEKYVSEIREKSMRHFELCDLKKYQEYKRREQEFEIWDKKTDKYIWIILGVSIGSGFLIAIWFGIILFIILVIILEVVNSQKRRYVEEVLPEYLLKAFQEEKRTRLEKIGDIKVEDYTMLFKNDIKRNLPKKNFCSNCGRKLKEEWRICPFCGKNG